MASQADNIMRTRLRGSPSWPGALLRGRIRWCRLIKAGLQNPLRTGRAIRSRRLRNWGRLTWSDQATCMHPAIIGRGVGLRVGPW